MCMLTDLFEFQIGDQAEPERVEKMKCKALLTVQKAEAEEIAPEKVARRADVLRKTAPRVLEPFCALIRIAEHRRLHECARVTVLPAQLLTRRKLSVGEVLGDP